jgi:glyoxylase-like metal-dependent hydrolase (beta-lactamase superfamily II)
MSSVKVGNVEILSILDLSFAFPYSAAYPGVPAEAWEPYKRIYPRSWTADGNWATNAQPFVLRSVGQTLLVDTGIGPGPDASGATGQLASNLAAAAVRPEDITTVIFTHLHYDHTGWSVVDGKPFFPNARYLAPEADWATLGQSMFPAAEAMKPLQDAGKLELVSNEKTVTPEITIVPTHGHTPGHQSVVIASAGERGFILGDVFNHPAQANEVEWNIGFDFDQDLARQTRRRVMERLEQDGSLVASGHYPAPGFGRLVRQDGRRIFREL